MRPSDKIIDAANAVSRALDAAVFVYSGPIDEEGFGRLVASMQSSDAQPARRNSILFLTTYGGDAGQAYRIARLLQSISDKFYLCVPSVCKSAGTLIALGAAEIFMPPASELGPLDVQLWRRDEIGQRRSGMVVRAALNGLAEETFKVYEHAMLGITVGSQQTISFDVASRVASTIATGVMAPVYQQIDPEALGNDLRDLSVATAYGERLIGHGGNATQETVRQLVEDYPTHDFIIDREEAKGLFINVDNTTGEMNALIRAFGEIVYLMQEPHVVHRVDRHVIREEKGSNDDNTDSEANIEAGADSGDGSSIETGLDRGRPAAR